MPSLGRKMLLPEIGDVPLDVKPDLRQLLENIIQIIQIREGNIAKGKNVRFVTIQDLVDAGVVADGVIE